MAISLQILLKARKVIMTVIFTLKARLTNVSAPIDDHDATTTKFVTDLLKGKPALLLSRMNYLKK